MHKEQDESCPYHYCKLLHVKVSQDTGQRLKQKSQIVTYGVVCLLCVLALLLVTEKSVNFESPLQIFAVKRVEMYQIIFSIYKM